MIIIMNLMIAMIGFGSIFFSNRLFLNRNKIWIRTHLFILALKLFFCSIIIFLFTIFSEKNIWSILIISGLVNLLIFHFIEAFITQKELLRPRKVNV